MDEGVNLGRCSTHENNVMNVVMNCFLCVVGSNMEQILHVVLLCIALHSACGDITCPADCNCKQPDQHTLIISVTSLTQGDKDRTHEDQGQAQHSQIQPHQDQDQNNKDQVQTHDQDYSNITTLKVFTDDHPWHLSYLCVFPHLEVLFLSAGKSQLHPGNFSVDCVAYLRVLHVLHTDLRNPDVGLQLELFSGVESLMELYLEHNAIGDLRNFAMGKWVNLQLLDISHNTLEKLKVHDGTHGKLNSLQKQTSQNTATDLTEFSTSDIKQHAANGSKSLYNARLSTWLLANSTRIIDMRMVNNGIDELPTELLAPLKSLQSLDLSENQISNISFLASVSDTITKINVRNNNVKELSGLIFQNMINLQSLDLGHNSISKLDIPLFTCCLRNFQFLFLEHNNISAVPLHAFGSLEKLIFLNLSHNHLTSLHVDMFTASNGSCSSDYLKDKCKSPDTGIPWKQFTSLDVSFNKMFQVSMDVFSHQLALVKYIDLSHNQLNIIPRIEQLPFLLTVNLSHNRLNWLDVGVFNNPQLGIIDLSHNQLTKIISMAFLYLPALEHLDMSHNEINYIYKMAFYRTCKHGQAMSIDLSMNQLHNDVLLKLVDCFKHLQDTACTVAIGLQHNALSRFLQQPSVSMHLLLQQNKDARFFNTWDHVEFSVENNQFFCDCKLVSDINVFEQMHDRFRHGLLHPRYLSFWQNATCGSPVKLKGVSVLDFKSKMSTRCHEEYICPKHCECVPHVAYTYVNCSYRNLHHPPVLLLPGPKTLHLQGNNFKHIASLQFQQVQSINLSSCNIESISLEAWTALLEIPSVSLQGNHLSTLPVETPCMFAELDIMDNPLQCGCGNSDLVEWLFTCNETLKDFEKLFCVNGTLVSELSTKHCIVSNSSQMTLSVVVLLSMCIIFIIGAVAIFALYYYRANIATYFLTKHRWHKVQAEEYDEYDIVIIQTPNDSDFVRTEILPTLQQYNSKCLQFKDWQQDPYGFMNTVQSTTMVILIASQHLVDDLVAEVGFRCCLDEFLDSSSPPVCLVSIEGTALPYKYPPHQKICYSAEDFHEKLIGVVHCMFAS